MFKVRFLSGNALKIIACITMLIDHMGVVLFPRTFWLRYIGRIAFPLFAFTIAEGCRYTRNKLKHFLLIFIAGVVYQIVFHLFSDGYLYFNILITLSISILCIYALQFAKKITFNTNKILVKIISWLPFIIGLQIAYYLTQKLLIDYGFIGIIMPIFASLLDFRDYDNKVLKVLDYYLLRVLCLACGVAIYVFTHQYPTWAWWSFIAVAILLFYNGKRGKLNLKYAFHIFYPTHLVLLEAIAMFLMQK